MFFTDILCLRSSDADPDVLADYVLALLTSDEPEDKIRANCLDNLEDFLKESKVSRLAIGTLTDIVTIDTNKFVDEIFVNYGSLPAPALPAHLPPRPPSPTIAQRRTSLNPFATRQGISARSGRLDQGHKALKAGRKRSFDEQNGRSILLDRPIIDTNSRVQKTRRQDRRSRALLAQQSFIPTNTPNGPKSAVFLPQSLPGFPMFDPKDPTAAIMAMQAFMQTFGMPLFGQRCHDYDTKGYCTKGAACPFQHGEDRIVAPDGSEYDPTDALTNPQRGSRRGRAKSGKDNGLSRSSRGPQKNDFSDANPNYDKAITTIVVERIPQPNLDEAKVREFFSQYGNVVDVMLQPYKHLALVRYDNYKAAKRAYDSPKVVFDNRFVKVYWYKPKEEVERPETNDQDVDAMDIDPETFARQQQAAQKNYEERMAKLKANAEARQKLQEEQRQWKERHEAEMKHLLTRIAAAESRRSGNKEENGDLAIKRESLNEKSLEKEEVQKALREQLALLEAEAKSLGIDPDAPATPIHGAISYLSFSPRGRGGYRGSRGSYRGGRGGYHTFRPNTSGSVIRLDNRPKRVAISLSTDSLLDADKDEALRSYLLSIGEFESIDQDPDQPQGQSVIVTYAERYQADMLVQRGRDIPGIGKVEMKWVGGGHIPATGTTTPVFKDEMQKRRSGRGDEDDDEDEHMTDDEDGEINIKHEATITNGNGEYASRHQPLAEVNYDVASDDEIT